MTSGSCCGCGAVRIVKHDYCKRCRMEGPADLQANAAEASA